MDVVRVVVLLGLPFNTRLPNYFFSLFRHRVNKLFSNVLGWCYPLLLQSKMKVTELKAELEVRGADTSGLKADLIERRQELVDKNGAAKEEKLKPPSSAAKSKPKSAKKPPKSASKAAAEEEDDKEAATEEPAAPPKSAAKPPKSAAKATPTKDSSKTPAKAKTPARTSPSPARSATKAASPAPAPTPAAPPAKFHYEFGGPIGAVGVMLGLPIVIYGLFFACGYSNFV